MTQIKHNSDSDSRKLTTLIHITCFNYHLQILLFKKKKKKEPSTSSSQRPNCHLLKFSEIQKATNNFDQSLLIRKGFRGDVYYGELCNADISVRTAIKRFSYPDSRPITEVEKRRLYALRHPNLVSLIGYYHVHEKETILVYEYVYGRTTLNDHLHVLRTPLSWIERLEICVAVAHGLQYLHQVGVFHADVRSSNILMTQSFVPKLTDYGFPQLSLSPHSPSHVNFSPRACGYVDPSLAHSGSLTMMSDVYSLAVLLLELLCRRPIMDAAAADKTTESLLPTCLVNWFLLRVHSSTDLHDLVDPKVKDEISPICFQDLFELAKQCLLEIPQKRPHLDEVVATLESILTLQKKTLNNPLYIAPSGVKELTFDDLEKATRGFSQNPLLGEARLKEVFLGWVDHKTLAPSEEGVGIDVAVKYIPRDDCPEVVNFLGQLDHPNIIKLLGCCSKDQHENLLVYEHMQRSLPHFIHGDDCLEPLSWGTRLNILIGVARGMAYLYTDKGVLCNFQCDDILLDEDFNAKLGGFGWVQVHQRHDRKQLKGVFGYLKADYDPDTGPLPMNDVVSFGLVVLETIAAKHPYDAYVDLESLDIGDHKSKSNKRKLKKVIDPRLKGNYSPKDALSLMALALKCMSVQPESRPSWEAIVWSLEQINALNK